MDIAFQLQSILHFVEPYYRDKDIMHDLSHLDRVQFALDKLLKVDNLEFDPFVLKAALYFHGLIYSIEPEISAFLYSLGLPETTIRLIIQVSWESQKESRPVTNEGLLLHDAHMLEGGKNFEIIKSLITGSVRGQSLEETMVYIEHNLLKKGTCYTPAGRQFYAEMKDTTQRIFRELSEGLGRDV